MPWLLPETVHATLLAAACSGCQRQGQRRTVTVLHRTEALFDKCKAELLQQCAQHTRNICRFESSTGLLLRFVIGHSANKDQEAAVDAEATRHGGFLRLPLQVKKCHAPSICMCISPGWSMQAFHAIGFTQNV